MFGNSGVSLGTYFGIPVRIHPSWLIVLLIMTMGWTNLLHEETGAPFGASLPWALGGVLVAFLSLLLHEFGHALAARHYGIRTRRITLFIFGGMAEIVREPETPKQEFIIAGAGPLVSLVLAVFFWGAGYVSMQAGLPKSLDLIVDMLFYINMVFAVFNMLPGFPMDGGRMLRAGIWAASGNMLSATRWASRMGQGFGVLIALIGVVEILLGNFSGLLMVLTGIYLRWLAVNSYQQTQFRSAVDSVKVRDLMRPVDVVIPAGASVAWAVRSVFNRHGADRYAVDRDGTLLGYVAARDVALVPLNQWDKIAVERLVRPWSPNELLSPEVPALTAYQRLGELARQSLPVFQGRELVGFLFLGDVSNHIGQFMDRTRL